MNIPTIIVDRVYSIVVIDNDLPRNTIVTNKNTYDFIIANRNYIAIRNFASCLALNDEDMFKNILYDNDITLNFNMHISQDIARILNVDFSEDVIQMTLFSNPVKFHRIDTFGPIQY